MSLSSHIGIDLSLNNFGPFRKGYNGERICCSGKQYINPYECEWFGLFKKDTDEKIPFSELTICKHCAINAFSPTETYAVSNEEMKKFMLNYNESTKFRCDMFDRNSMEKYGYIDRRVSVNNGIQVNINIVNPENPEEWVPAIIPYSEDTKDKDSDKRLHIALLPSHVGWEFVIKIDPLGMYYEKDYCFKIKKINDITGKEITTTTESGSKDFYIPFNSQFIIRGYKTGVSGEKFFFISPTQEEKIMGKIAEHNNKSSKILLKLEVYKKIFKEPVYRGLNQSDTLTRSIRSNQRTRSLNGGSTFSAGGYNPNVNVSYVDAEFKHIDTIDFAIQLVNNESNEELNYAKNLLEETEKKAKKNKIESFKNEKIKLENSFQNLIKQKEMELLELKENFNREIERINREIENKEREYGFLPEQPPLEETFIIVD